MRWIRTGRRWSGHPAVSCFIPTSPHRDADSGGIPSRRRRSKAASCRFAANCRSTPNGIWEQCTFPEQCRRSECDHDNSGGRRTRNRLPADDNYRLHGSDLSGDSGRPRGSRATSGSNLPTAVSRSKEAIGFRWIHSGRRQEVFTHRSGEVSGHLHIVHGGKKSQGYEKKQEN